MTRRGTIPAAIERSRRDRGGTAALGRGAVGHRPHRAGLHREPVRARAVRGGARRRRRHPRRCRLVGTIPPRWSTSGCGSSGDGVSGYVTPKVAVGAVVGNDDGEILLIQRSDSGIWLYPTGWADIGYSAVRGRAEGGPRGDRHRGRGARTARRVRRSPPRVQPHAAVLAGVPLPRRRRRAGGPSRSSASTSAGSARDDLPEPLASGDVLGRARVRRHRRRRSIRPVLRPRARPRVWQGLPDF